MKELDEAAAEVMPEDDQAQCETDILVLRQMLQQARAAVSQAKLTYILETRVGGVIDNAGHPEQIKQNLAKQEKIAAVILEELQGVLEGRAEGKPLHVSALSLAGALPV